MKRKLWSYKSIQRNEYALMMADDPHQESAFMGIHFVTSKPEDKNLITKMVAGLNAEEMRWVRENCCCDRPHMHGGVDHTSIHSDYSKEHGEVYDIHCPKCKVHSE